LRFEAKERLGIDWRPTLVNYEVSFKAGRAYPGQLRLVDESGVEVSFQLSRVRCHPDGSIASARISFMAELKKGSSYSFTLVPGRPTISDGPCKAFLEGGYLRLDNGIVALRLPKPGEYIFEPPLRFGTSHQEMICLYGRQVENGIAPGPIQGLRLADGRWIGGSYFCAEVPDEAPRVTGYTCEVTEQGVLFVEARVRYTFDNGGDYQFMTRLLANDPAVRIDEQFDMRCTGDSFMWRMVVSLSSGWEADGWKPDHVYWYSASPPPANIPGDEPELERQLSALGFDVQSYRTQTFNNGKLHYNEPYRKVFDVAVWYPWNKNAHYFGLLDSRTLSPASARRDHLPFIGVIPMHAGNWRGASGAQNGMLFTHQGDDVALHWPLLVKPHPKTLLDTGEYDPDLPFTFGRRQWALVAGPLQYHGTMHQFRKYEGYITLDDYKDWVLEWPVNPQVTYPRLAFSKQENDDEGRREELWQSLTSRDNLAVWQKQPGPLAQAVGALTGRLCQDQLEWVNDYHQTTMAGWAMNMDELLASLKLTEEQRRQLRTHLAALCYVLTEPDFNPRGSMIHLGNPNMPINRFFALAFAAALIPDHPMADKWLDVAAEYLRYKLAMNVGPNGAWSELISYFHASAPFLMQAALVLRQAGRLDDATARLATLPARFTMQLLSPKDPRFGTRILPGWGHEGYFIYTHWLVAAELIQEGDPELAKALIWSWDQLGRPTQHDHDLGFSERLILNADLLDGLESDYVPAEMRSTWLPGFGVVMRAHVGDPNETCLQYRQGYLISHCDANQGDFLLYSKGAPLTTFSLFGYALYDVEGVPSPFRRLHETFGWHNRVRFGSQEDFGGWPGGGPISQVHAHFFSDSGDYLRGLGDYGPQRWTRQILFLKGKAAAGPNYFVFRDSFHNLKGQPDKLEQKWWYLRTPGSKDLVSVSEHELNYTSPYGPKLNVHFLMPTTIQAQRKDATHNGPLWYQAGMNWRKAGSPIAQDGRDFGPHSISVNETITVSAVGPIAPGQDILTVLYPQAPEEGLPQYELLADGVARITTSESIDYVFVNREPMTFQQDDVSFEGIVGMVRVYPDEVHLVVAEGPGTVSYKGTLLRSPVPVSKVIPMDQIGRLKVIEIPPPQTSLTFSFNRKVEFVKVMEGVKRADFPGGFAYTFDNTEPFEFEAGGVTFVGSRGGVVVDEERGSVQLVLLQGERIGYQGLQAWGCEGPYEATFYRDRITGRTDGLGRFLYLSIPEGLDRLPVLVLDGQTYAPGTSEDTLIVPVMPGEHQFEIRALEQPPIWRNWQVWEGEITARHHSHPSVCKSHSEWRRMRRCSG
jgi:hypothetical protein